eukprot:scaffold65675_cov85-Phaeocystis_antarctica.AAC.2
MACPCSKLEIAAPTLLVHEQGLFAPSLLSRGLSAYCLGAGRVVQVGVGLCRPAVNQESRCVHEDGCAHLHIWQCQRRACPGAEAPDVHIWREQLGATRLAVACNHRVLVGKDSQVPNLGRSVVSKSQVSGWRGEWRASRSD